MPQKTYALNAKLFTEIKIYKNKTNFKKMTIIYGFRLLYYESMNSNIT